MANNGVSAALKLLGPLDRLLENVSLADVAAAIDEREALVRELHAELVTLQHLKRLKLAADGGQTFLREVKRAVGSLAPVVFAEKQEQPKAARRGGKPPLLRAAITKLLDERGPLTKAMIARELAHPVGSVGELVRDLRYFENDGSRPRRYWPRTRPIVPIHLNHKQDEEHQEVVG